jgi:hypothetical protein
MAKYSRHDPRNKKQDNNKNKTLQKDIRIRNIDDKRMLKEVAFDNENDHDPLSNQQLLD